MRRKGSAALVALPLIVAAAAATAASPQGGEFVVPAATQFTQEDAVVTIAGNGAFAVAWQTEPAAASADDVGLRLFNADGSPATGDLDVASGSPADQDDPQIAGNASGAGVVIYEFTADPSGGDFAEIQARMFTSAGVLGPVIAVNAATIGSEEAASVAMNASGAWVAAWRTGVTADATGRDIRAQRFDATGAKVGAELAVNLTTAANQDRPTVGLDDSGAFTIAWQDSALDGDGEGIYARTFAADGTPLTGEVAVNVTTANNQADPDLARDSDGDTVVVWEGEGPGGVISVWGRRLSAAGGADGPEVQLSSAPVDSDGNPAVAVDAAGRPTVVWDSEDDADTSQGVFVRDFQAGLTSPTDQSFVNATRPLEQAAADVSLAADGRMVVSWSGRGAASTDSDALSRRATRTEPVVVTPTPSVTPAPTAPPATATVAPPKPTPTPVATPEAAVKAGSVIKLPGTRKCVSRRRFRIRLVRPKGVELAAARVFVNGKRVKVVKGSRLRSVVDLRGLPKGRFTVKVEVTTKAGKLLRSKRRYRTCVPKRK